LRVTQCWCQLFEKTIATDPGPAWGTSVSFVEIQSNIWISTFYTSYQTPTSLLILTEQGSEVGFEIVPIASPQYQCRTGHIIKEWSDSNVVVGYGNFLDRSDSTELLMSFSWNGETLDFQLIDSLNSPLTIVDHTISNERPDSMYLLLANALDTTNTLWLYTVGRDMVLVSKDFATLGHWAFMTDIKMTSSGKLLMSAYDACILRAQLNPFSILDTLWLGQNPGTSDTLSGLASITQISPMPDDILLMSGSIKIDRNPSPVTVDLDADIILFKLDSNGNSIQERYFGKADTIVPNAVFDHLNETCGFRSVDMNNEGDIFIAGTSNILMSSPAVFYEEKPTWIEIAKLSPNLDTIWHLWHGDTAESRFFNYGLMALNDGGALVFSLKYDYSNHSEQGLDIHILRLKADGSLYTLDIPFVEKPASDRFKLYPNPAFAEVEMRGPVQAIEELSLRDQFGRIVLKTTNTESLNVSTLSTGTYFVEVLLKNGSTEFAGRIIKY